MSELELAIIGGGPAGLSAALVAKEDQLQAKVFEAGPELGGQLLLIYAEITTFLGRHPANGRELRDVFAAQAKDLGVEIQLGARIDRVERTEDGFQLAIGDERVPARRVLLATGMRPRALGLLDEHTYRLHLRAQVVGDRLKGARVVVIGGGDEAIATSSWIAKNGAQVTIVARKELHGRPLLVDLLRTTPGITVKENDQVVALEGDGHALSAVKLLSGAVMPADFCFARAGVEPTAPLLIPEPKHEPDGRLRVDGYGRTSIPGLYAVGDMVVTGDRGYLSHATGSGAIAARAAETDRDQAAQRA